MGIFSKYLLVLCTETKLEYRQSRWLQFATKTMFDTSRNPATETRNGTLFKQRGNFHKATF